jgi:hypothetical protein
MFNPNTFHPLLETERTVCVSEKAIGMRDAGISRYVRYVTQCALSMEDPVSSAGTN